MTLVSGMMARTLQFGLVMAIEEMVSAQKLRRGERVRGRA